MSDAPWARVPRSARHRREPHRGSVAARLGWLRAGVMGANDGIVSTAGLVVGVAAATTSASAIATAGSAGLVAGAVSMALGEYVSVSSQRDTEEALVRQEADELARLPELERRELIGMLEARGLSEATSARAADELTAHDALATHLELELGLDQDQLADPWAAAGSSALSFTVGAALPLVAILVPPASVRIPVAVIAVLLALAGTGVLSARLGGAAVGRAVVRLVGGGAAALAVTYAIGEALGTAVG
ncbi:VIT family protein [Iamia sp. SCSIO 61187]|uniref:VIT1/CCC1 transporter family protein n=1 Tax=Iamia sp. SCSIO 61187 TaxID=2722752 RepID=UPI001C62A343|nr:VIT family protein [Iamia sp. SCSIO 61187]QYG93497.1 VIT family protein [Iamia sp. SCSIO 61187]